MKILVVVPTRSRPQNARRLYEAFNETRVLTDTTRLFFAVDDDDPQLDEYLKLKDDGATVIVGERLRLAPTLNFIATGFSESYDIIGFMGDDHLPRTLGWDEQISNAMRPAGIVYGNDLFQGPNLPTAVFVDAHIVRTLGYMVPRGFTHLYLDNTWKTWGERLGTLTYLNDVIIEHMHPHAGKADGDDQYAEVNSSEMYSADGARFAEYMENELDNDITKIKRDRGL